MNKLRHLKSQKQGGTAVIMALFIMTLVAIAATAMSVRINIDIHRTELIINADKLYLLTEKVKYWAMGRLAEETSTTNAQHKQATLNLNTSQFPSYQFQNNTVEGYYADRQGCFNINNLSNPANLERFSRFLKSIDPSASRDTVNRISSNILHWLNSPHARVTDAKGPQSILFLFHRHQGHSSFFADVSELRLIDGMTRELYEKINPYVCALPETTPTNINSAEIPVLMSLSPRMTQSIAHAIVNQTKSKPFANIEEFKAFPGIKNLHIPGSSITFTSNYFMIYASSRNKKQQINIRYLAHRKVSNMEARVDIIKEQRGP